MESFRSANSNVSISVKINKFTGLAELEISAYVKINESCTYSVLGTKWFGKHS